MHTVSSQRLSPKGKERQFGGMKVPTALSANQEQEASSIFDKAVSNFHGSAAAPMIRQEASAMVGFQSTAVPATNQSHESQKVSYLFGFLLISFFDLPRHCATACVRMRFSIVCSPIELRQKGKDGAKMGSATRPLFPVSGRL